MQIRSIIPENIQDVKLFELQKYNLDLGREYEHYAKESFSVQKSLRELEWEREARFHSITVQVANQQLAIAKAANRYTPKERTSVIQSRMNTEFEEMEEYRRLELEQVQLDEVRRYLDFQADRLKQAILAATAHKKYGGQVDNNN